jgi:hypothetical protein
MTTIEKSLEEKFKKIFEVNKVTFANPSKEVKEQECIFVDIDQTRTRQKDKKIIARVTGKINIYGNSDKMPLGWFDKKLIEADPADKADLAFFDIEMNTKYYQNLVQRTASFVYFFSSQYDPNVGSITSMTISVEET